MKPTDTRDESNKDNGELCPAKLIDSIDSGKSLTPEDSPSQPRSSRDIGIWSPRSNRRPNWRGRRSRAHPWKHIREEDVLDSLDERFSNAPGQLRHLVKDGQALDSRGAELLMNREMRILDDIVRDAARQTWAKRPQPVVVSPPDNRPYSLAGKKVHQYQQTRGRK